MTGVLLGRSERAVLVLMLIAASVLFLAGLGGSSLWDQDEAKYTQVAREILQTGDPITLHVNGSPWFVHPPLYMWLQAATGWAFGFSEFTARVWSALFGVVGLLVTYLLGRMLFGTRTAVLGTIVLMTMFQYFAQSRLAIFDVALVAFMLLASDALLRSLRESSPRLAVWAFAWAGLGTLTKGPIALLLPGLVAAAFLWLRRDRVRWQVPWFRAIAAYALLGTPWYLVEWIRHGWPFVRTVIGYYTVTRFLGVVEGQAGPWWYYAPVFGIGAFPWTAFLVAMIFYHARRTRDDGSLIVLLWCGITVVFYSVAGTKLPNYVLPAYPMAALGIASMWEGGFSGEARARRHLTAAVAFTVAALILFAAEIAAFGQVKYPADFAALQHHLLLAAIVVGVWLMGASTLYAMRRLAVSFTAFAGTMVLLAAILISRTLPLVEAHRPAKVVAAAIRQELSPGTVLVGVDLSDNQTLLYYTNHHIIWMDDPDGLLRLVCKSRRVVIVTRTEEYEQWVRFLSFYVRPPIRLVAQQGHLTAVIKEDEAGCLRNRLQRL